MREQRTEREQKCAGDLLTTKTNDSDSGLIPKVVHVRREAAEKIFQSQSEVQAEAATVSHGKSHLVVELQIEVKHLPVFKRQEKVWKP